MNKSKVKNKTVVIPDGHKVVFVKPSPEPAFNKAESGFWIADFGSQEYIEAGFKIVENILREDPTSSVIWVLQKALLDYWAADVVRVAELLRRFRKVQLLRVASGGAGNEMLSYWTSGVLNLSEILGPNPPLQQRRVADIAVVAATSSNAQALMILLNSIGITPHSPDAENKLFAEIHKPDKIVVGMPGPTLGMSVSDATLLALYREHEKAESTSAPSSKLSEIKQSELRHIEQVLRRTKPLVNRLLRIEEPENAHRLLSSLMLQLSRDAQIFPRFIKAFLRSKVGVHTFGGKNTTGSEFVSTSEAPLQINLTAVHDGRERILVCADPPLYDLRYGMPFNSVVNGDEILKIAIANPDCAGIYINNALSESGMIISRETAMSALKS